MPRVESWIRSPIIPQQSCRRLRQFNRVAVLPAVGISVRLPEMDRRWSHRLRRCNPVGARVAGQRACQAWADLARRRFLHHLPCRQEATLGVAAEVLARSRLQERRSFHLRHPFNRELGLTPSAVGTPELWQALERVQASCRRLLLFRVAETAQEADALAASQGRGPRWSLLRRVFRL